MRGDTTEKGNAVPEPNSGFVSVAAGSFHSLGLKADGSIVAWGWNGGGQCNVPSPNAGFLAVDGGESHSIALKADGSIVAWGDNAWTQCDTPSPNGGFTAVAAGEQVSFGLRGGVVVAGLPSDDHHVPARGIRVVSFPNPFNPRTTIRYDLPAAGPVRLSVFDVAGRLVRTLVDESLTPGNHEAAWDGRDASGRETGSGSYLARLEFGGRWKRFIWG